MKNNKIYVVNSRDNIILQLINYNNNFDMYKEINDYFNFLDFALKSKNIDYSKLKNALIPQRNEEKYEYAFVFDSSYFHDTEMFYGEKIINKILSIINKESCHSIMAGDYVKVNIFDSTILKNIFLEKIEYIKKFDYKYSDQFYIVYINNITKNQINNMIDELRNELYFVGVMNLKYNCRIKSYFSNILINVCIKYKDNVIVPHFCDELFGDYNEQGYAYNENGFRIISIQQLLYDLFLTYKIPSGIIQKDEIQYEYMALSGVYPDYNNLKVKVDYEKWEKYLKIKKAEDMRLLNLYNLNIDELEKCILINMMNNYIYNLEKNEYGDLKFNVLIELEIDKNIFKNVLIALKFNPDKNEVKLITMY